MRLNEGLDFSRVRLDRLIFSRMPTGPRMGYVALEGGILHRSEDPLSFGPVFLFRCLAALAHVTHNRPRQNLSTLFECGLAENQRWLIPLLQISCPLERVIATSLASIPSIEP